MRWPCTLHFICSKTVTAYLNIAKEVHMKTVGVQEHLVAKRTNWGRCLWSQRALKTFKDVLQSHFASSTGGGLAATKTTCLCLQHCWGCQLRDLIVFKCLQNTFALWSFLLKKRHPWLLPEYMSQVRNGFWPFRMNHWAKAKPGIENVSNYIVMYSNYIVLVFCLKENAMSFWNLFLLP